MKTAALISTFLLTHALTAPAADTATFVEFPAGYVLGGHSGGKWIESEKAGKTMKPGTSYRVFTLKGPTEKLTATKISPGPEVCTEVWMAEFNDIIDQDAIAVSAPWNPMPRAVKSADTKQDVYVKAVGDILVAKGIVKPRVKIAQVLRADLDGDSEEEVLISATHYSNTEDGAPNAASAGNYSFVALRRMVNGKVETHIIEGEFYPKNMEFNAPNIYQVTGVLDLDGDGKMEIIVNSAYYEGGATTVWKLGRKKLEKVMEIACGV